MLLQTYTYAIRPMRDSPSGSQMPPQSSSSDPTPPPTRELSSTLATEAGPDTAGMVHSYEVCSCWHLHAAAAGADS